MSATVELVQEHIDQGKKVIIFTNFTEELDMFMRIFGDIAVKHHGPMSSTEKQRSVDRFQEDNKVKVFVGNIKSAGVGITLTAAETVIVNSLDWVPGNHAQAEDRAYRIGQDKKVNVFYPIIDDTVDSIVWDILNNKKRIITTVIGDVYEENVIQNIIDSID